MNNFFEELKKYFEVIPQEKVLEDWAKSAEFDNIVTNQRVGTFCKKCGGVVCVCKYINKDKIMESFILNAKQSKQSKQIYTNEDMKSFGDWCRNGLLNTEYSVDSLDQHLEKWKQLN